MVTFKYLKTKDVYNSCHGLELFETISLRFFLITLELCHLVYMCDSGFHTFGAPVVRGQLHIRGSPTDICHSSINGN